ERGAHGPVVPWQGGRGGRGDGLVPGDGRQLRRAAPVLTVTARCAGRRPITPERSQPVVERDHDRFGATAFSELRLGGTGAGLLAAGVLIGRRSRRRPGAARETPTPRCACDHSLAEHNRDSNLCHAQIQRPRYNKYGDWTGHEYTPCTCQQYVGPVPLEQV